jgi:hypothetical protein
VALLRSPQSLFRSRLLDPGSSVMDDQNYDEFFIIAFDALTRSDTHDHMWGGMAAKTGL